MALRVIEIGIALTLMSMLLPHASAQSGCTTAIVSLAPCLGYITGNSSTPSSSCCSQLASVVQSQPRCLCSVLNGGASSLGITINQTRALDLPGACKVQTPPVSQCNAVGSGPAATPAESPKAPSTPVTPSTPSTPANPSPETPSTPSVPSGTAATPSAPSVPSGPSASGSKTVPSTAGAYSGASSDKRGHSVMVFILFLAACISLTSL